MTDFSRYTDATLSALQHSSRAKDQETVTKKQEILDGVYEFHNFVPSTTLFIGFNPAILSKRNGKVFATGLSDASKAYLDGKVAYEYIPEEKLFLEDRKFDVVVAMDEYFTYMNTSEQQQVSVKQICNLAKEFVISTLRDYKNQEFKDREFSIPAVVRNGDSNVVYNEFHNWSHEDRNKWVSTVHEIETDTNDLTTYGPFARHTMYFKQLAKFSMDAGADDFIVHKNLMYKSLIKRNYEHVISIRFDR
jgi:hypothetical protein